MKRRKEHSKSMQIMRLWNVTDAVKAIPYLRSVIGSLRDHWLDVLNAKRQLDLPLREKTTTRRQQIMERATQEDDLQRAQSEFDDALDELSQIDVFLLDPVRGFAVIPFRAGDDLAWFIFELFAEPGLIGWRYHDDPIELCRPLSLLEDAAVSPFYV